MICVLCPHLKDEHCLSNDRFLMFERDIGDFAVVDMSLSRHNVNFKGLLLDQALRDHHAQPRCGIQGIDLKAGNIAHSIRLGGVVQELYDVVVLPNTRNAVALNFNKTDLPKMLNPPPTVG